MRIAALSDIHGNLPALEAVLAMDAIEAGGGPRAGQLARRHLLEPPSEDEILRVFARAGI